MTDQMKIFLNRASSKIGTPSGNYSIFREASNSGWIKSRGAPQNSTTIRYELTDSGAQALSAAQ